MQANLRYYTHISFLEDCFTALLAHSSKSVVNIDKLLHICKSGFAQYILMKEKCQNHAEGKKKKSISGLFDVS